MQLAPTDPASRFELKPAPGEGGRALKAPRSLARQRAWSQEKIGANVHFLRKALEVARRGDHAPHVRGRAETHEAWLEDNRDRDLLKKQKKAAMKLAH